MSPITTFTIATETDLMSLPYREPQQPVDDDDDEESLCPSETTSEEDDLVSDLNSSISSLNLEDVFVPPKATPAPAKNTGKKRSRSVRFAQEEEATDLTIEAAETTTAAAVGSWWTRDELKSTQRSFVFAVKRQELGMRAVQEEEKQDAYDSLLLDGSSSRCRKRRKTVRSQVISTIAAVRDYEAVTKTETPPEMIAKLIERYTAPSVFEASQRAKALEKVAANKSASSPRRKTTAKKTSSPALPTVSELVKVTAAAAAMSSKKASTYSQHSSCSSLFASARGENNFSLQNSSSALAA